jgi:hypothetical protein
MTNLLTKSALFALVCAAGLAACGGGGGGTPLPHTSATPVATATPTPTVAPTATPPTATTTFSVQAFPTSVPLPALDGYSGSLLLPGITGIGSVTVTVSTQPIASAQAVRRKTMTATMNLPLIYVSLTPSGAITLRGSPGFAITAPASLNLAGENFYASIEQGTQWYALGNPGTVSGSTVTVNADTTAQSIDIAAGKSQSFALIGTGIATLAPAVSSFLTIGTPTTVNVSVQAADGFGAPITGPLATPITITDSDTSGQTSLGGTSITSTSQTVALTYNGKGASFNITATSGSVTGQANVTTSLPKETPLTGGFTGFPGSIILGSDGNFWMTGGTGAVRITPGGQATQFTDPTSTHTPDGTRIAKDNAGNLWVPYHDSYSERYGINRVSTSGTFTSFPTTDGSPNTMIEGPDGAVWMGMSSASYGSATVARIDSSGIYSTVATVTNLPSNMVLGSDNNVWFSETTNIDRVTSAGAVSAFAIPYAPAGMNPVQFTVGPDGNFWLPFPFGFQELMKISTSGAVVSSTPLTFTAPWDWYYSMQKNLVPLMSEFATDANGNIYTTDSNTQAVLRITPSGQLSAYPMYSAYINRTQDPMHVCMGADGKLYVLSFAEPSLTAQSVLAITPVDPASW